MATRYRDFIPECTYFITFTILDWNNIFINDEYCSLVYKWFDYIKKKYDDEIYGYVIMPNHIHCLLAVSATSPPIPKIIQNAKRFMAYQIVALLKKDKKYELLSFFREQAKYKKGARHKVFEDGYDSLMVYSQKIFLEKINYIHNNPCREKWNLADKPENYKHSSAANYLDSKGCYDVNVIDF